MLKAHMQTETPLMDKKLLKLLVCPLTGAQLEIDGDHLVNTQNTVSYPIINGIPVMDPKYLPSEKSDA